MRKRKVGMILGLVVFIPVGVVAWWLLAPLFTSTTVEEEFPRAAKAEIPDGMTMAEVEETLSVMARLEQPLMAEAMPPGPAAVSAGVFRDGDSFHKGSGSAIIYRKDDGAHILRLEDFSVTNGPDLRVLLAAAPDPQNRRELQAAGYIHLAKLKGNRGSQNYEIPADVDPTAQGSVIIYCMPFRVIFSVASLKGV